MAIVAETKGFDVKTRVCDYTKWSIITGSKTESGRFKHACLSGGRQHSSMRRFVAARRVLCSPPSEVCRSILYFLFIFFCQSAHEVGEKSRFTHKMTFNGTVSHD